MAKKVIKAVAKDRKVIVLTKKVGLSKENK